MSKIIKAQPLPNSWLVSEWPRDVVPNSQPSATHMVRQHRKELIACGALGRIGRNLVIFGQGYGLFLSRKADRVENYVIAPNRTKPVKIAPVKITPTAIATKGTKRSTASGEAVEKRVACEARGAR